MAQDSFNKNLLFYLLNNPNPISGQELSDVLNITKNTLAKEVQLSNEYLEDYGCEITGKTSAGYSLTVLDDKTAEPFFRQFKYEHNRLFYTRDQSELTHVLLRRLLCAEDCISIEDLASDCFYSRSTVIRNLDGVREQLGYYDLKLTRNAQGLAISGGEWRVRQLILCEIKLYLHGEEYNERFEKLFTLKQMPNAYDRIREIFLDFVYDKEYSIPYIDISKITNYIILCITRRKHPLCFTEEQMNAVEAHKMFRFAQEFIVRLPEEIRSLLNPDDIRGLAILLLTYKAIRRVQYSSGSHYLDNIALGYRFIIYLQSNYPVSLKYDDDLLYLLGDYFYLLKYRLLFEVYIDQELVQFPAHPHALTIEMCAMFYRYYLETFDIKLSRVNVMGAAVIFETFINQNHMNTYTAKALAVSIYGKAVSNYMADSIERQYPNSLESIVPIDMTDIARISLQEYDILFTDRYNVEDRYPYVVTIPVDVRHIHDIPNIEPYLDFLLTNKTLSWFSEDHIHQSSFTEKEEVYGAIMDVLAISDRDRENFRNELIQQDEYVNWVRDNGVVFIDTTFWEKKLSLHIWRNTRMLWNGNRCYLIVCYSRGEDLLENRLLNTYLYKVEDLKPSELNNLAERLIRNQL